MLLVLWLAKCFTNLRLFVVICIKKLYHFIGTVLQIFNLILIFLEGGRREKMFFKFFWYFKREEKRLLLLTVGTESYFYFSKSEVYFNTFLVWKKYFFSWCGTVALDIHSLLFFSHKMERKLWRVYWMGGTGRR